MPVPIIAIQLESEIFYLLSFSSSNDMLRRVSESWSGLLALYIRNCLWIG